jgi:hypothetical protein
MAGQVRHAAGFTVRLLTESGAETELASELPDLAAATDYAFEWLNREDPTREAHLRLLIVRVDEAGAHTVLRYPPDVQRPGEDLVSLFGFNPVTWQRHDLSRPATVEPRLRPPARPPAPPQPLVDADPDPVEPEPRSRDWTDLVRGAGAIVRSSWDDLVSRAFLSAAVLAMWLTVTLLEPVFFAVVLAMLAALWTRRRQLQAREPDDDFDF